MAHVRQSRRDYGLGLMAKVLTAFQDLNPRPLFADGGGCAAGKRSGGALQERAGRACEDRLTMDPYTSYRFTMDPTTSHRFTMDAYTSY